jgi:hypothetical protein
MSGFRPPLLCTARLWISRTRLGVQLRWVVYVLTDCQSKSRRLGKCNRIEQFNASHLVRSTYPPRCFIHGAANLRTIATGTPKSFATLAGVKPALTAARTILALAGGMSPVGATLRMIFGTAGSVGCTAGVVSWPLSFVSATKPIPRRRVSPIAMRIRCISSSFSSWPTPCARSGSFPRRF